MYKLTLGLVVLEVASSIAAQNYNPNYINTLPFADFDFSRGVHPGTGNSYSLANVVPAGYRSGATGVLPGTRMWRVIPAHAWRRAEPRLISGITYVAASSAATPSPNNYAYSFETTLGGTLPRSGGGLDPDYSAPYLRLPQFPVPGGPRQMFRVTQTFAPIAMMVNDAAIWFRYAGGENEDLDANVAQTPSQTMVYSKYADVTPWPTMGVDEGVRRHITGPHELLVTVLEEGPVCRVETEWGRLRVGGSPPAQGLSLSSYWGPMLGGRIGFAIYGGRAHANEWTLAFLNAGSVYGGALRLGPHVIELDPRDPLLGIGYPGVIPLDASGNSGCCGLAVWQWGFPPGFLGLALGLEAITLDPTTMTITGTTGAQWILVNRP